MNDLTYNVNKETKKIECIVHNCKTDFMRVTDKVLSRYTENIRYFYRFIAIYHCDRMIRDEYSGTATCSDADKFNEEYGRDLARTKAIIKREQAFISALEAIFNDISTLMDINIEINRDNIFDRHVDNLYDLLDSGKSLADMYDYDCDDEYGIADNIDLNHDYTPHCCSLCGKIFLNYTDDVEYEENEQEWFTLDTVSHKQLEICSACADTLIKLTN